MNITFTHPDVFDKGVREGWADPRTDPAQIDWTGRQATAAIPFEVIDGRPVNPCEKTGIRYGRNELGHWGEQLAADAIVTVDTKAGRWLVMVERSDGHGWAIPGGYVEPGEDPEAAAVRELEEETCLNLSSVSRQVLPARYVSDPRASDEAWMVTVPVRFNLAAGGCNDLPAVVGADDAMRAVWVHADSYDALVDDLDITYGGQVFRAHQAMLRDLLG
ncbi:NUDIX domain-containing protein [Nonomuraea ceibae]|uniref:NUDIX domain-containing protein n=1 Tax=Nonomuraea ceibae TaxID=1935170 RepID=UPI001C6011D1|nr:NUDIX domain-containing protein [Nonomuraea ceibae]